MAQDFIAKIEGQADLSKAKQSFDAFKKQVEQPIKLTFDTSGFNAAWSNIQNAFKQQGQNASNAFNNGFFANIKNVDVGRAIYDKLLRGFSSSSGIIQETVLGKLGATSGVYKQLEKELDSLAIKGAQLTKLKFNESGTKFIAQAVNDMGTLVTLTGRWHDEIKDAQGVIQDPAGWKITESFSTDFTKGLKEAQAEAKKLAQEVQKVKDAFSTGTFDAQTAKMENGLLGIGGSATSDQIKKASDAASEYYKIIQDIESTLNGTSQNPLVGQDLVDAYDKAQLAVKAYDNAMREMGYTEERLLKEGVANRNADNVEAWAKKNSRAMGEYGAAIEDLIQKMRAAKTEGEMKDLTNQFKNLKAEVNARGLGGLSFLDQFKKAFVRIGEFTGIYAVTSQIRRLPSEMAQEVIKIDTAMTELRKVSTATADEISDYFDKAADSAYKYGEAIDEVVNSTASWTRLGYNLKDASTLTDVTAELAKVGSGLNVDSATEGLQATIRGFQMTADEAKRVGDIINYIADTEPIDALGIINGLERSSAAMSEANNSLGETIGLITAATSVTQDATSAGVAWKTISMRIRGKFCASIHVKYVCGVCL